MIEPNEIMSPLMSASATVTGLTLVFLGIVITTRQAYEAATPAKVLRPLRVDGVIIFAAFVVGVAAVCLAAFWFVTRGGVRGTYVAFLIVGVLQVVATVAAAGRVLYRVW